MFENSKLCTEKLRFRDDLYLYNVYEDYMDNFDVLSETFPTKRFMLDNSTSELQTFSHQTIINPRQEGITLSKEWEEFIDYHTGKEYFDKIFSTKIEDEYLFIARPYLLNAIISGNYDFNKDISIEVSFCINNVRMVFDSLRPVPKNTSDIFEVIYYMDDKTEFNYFENDFLQDVSNEDRAKFFTISSVGNITDVKTIQYKPNSAVLSPFHDNISIFDTAKLPDGKFVKIKFCLDGKLKDTLDDTKQEEKYNLDNLKTIYQYKTRNSSSVHDTPWKHAIIDDYVKTHLGEDTYKKLEATFPSRETILEYDSHSKRKKRKQGTTSCNIVSAFVPPDTVINSNFMSCFNGSIDLSDNWIRFIKYHLDRKEELFESFFDMFEDYWSEYKPELLKLVSSREYTMRQWDRNGGQDQCLWEDDILFDFKFIHKSDESHEYNEEIFVDGGKKILQILLFFPDPEETEEYQYYLHGDETKLIEYVPDRLLVLPVVYFSKQQEVTPKNFKFQKKMLQIVFFENEWKGENRYRADRWNTLQSWEASQAGPKYKEKIDNLQKIKNEIDENKYDLRFYQLDKLSKDFKEEEESENLRSRSSLLNQSQQKWKDHLDYMTEDERRRLTMKDLIDEVFYELEEDN